jgi:uncharacterized membrane protein YoaK (UPF0700 family)
MFRMKKRSYRVFEGLRVATLVSYIGGFIDAYTYNTQDGRFRQVIFFIWLFILLRGILQELSAM